MSSSPAILAETLPKKKTDELLAQFICPDVNDYVNCVFEEGSQSQTSVYHAVSSPEMKIMFNRLLILSVFLLTACQPPSSDQPEPAATLPELSSWNFGSARAAIETFVADVTNPESANFVPASERIAVFDNDGTLWAEQPLYFQVLFAIDQVIQMAPEHPEWQEQEPFSQILAGDVEGALAGGEEALIALIMATHTGMSSAEFAASVNDWMSRAKHPTHDRPYNEMLYQPMLDVLAYLRAHDFKTFIVSGGGIGFMRPWAYEAYGIPTEQVVGSANELELQYIDGEPLVMRNPGIGFINDKEGKPVGIMKHIGRRPTMAFGNSDGDLQMIEWTTAGEGPSLGVIIHHTDAEREWAYDRDSHIGRLDKALDMAPEHGWLVVDMAADWAQVFSD